LKSAEPEDKHVNVSAFRVFRGKNILDVEIAETQG
jgi:hypothetical protein